MLEVLVSAMRQLREHRGVYLSPGWLADTAFVIMRDNISVSAASRHGKNGNGRSKGNRSRLKG